MQLLGVAWHRRRKIRCVSTRNRITGVGRYQAPRSGRALRTKGLSSFLVAAYAISVPETPQEARRLIDLGCSCTPRTPCTYPPRPDSSIVYLITGHRIANAYHGRGMLPPQSPPGSTTPSVSTTHRIERV
eukprot:2933274-Rhodomonas_salina.1